MKSKNIIKVRNNIFYNKDIINDYIPHHYKELYRKKQTHFVIII